MNRQTQDLSGLGKEPQATMAVSWVVLVARQVFSAILI